METGLHAMESKWKKIIAEHARDVVDASDITDPSAALLTEDITPGEFIQALVKARLWLDAARVLAYALPRREALWWACLCAEGMEAVRSEKSEQFSLAAAEKWVYEPSDKHRADAYISAQKCKGSSGGLMCALAAAMSEESLPFEGDQVIEFDATAFPGLVFAVIVLAADEGEENLMDQRLQQYLAIGEDIARGGRGKKETQPA